MDEKITYANLERNGWTLDNEITLESIDTFFKEIDGFVCQLKYGVANLYGRDWTLHIDNCDMDTVATLDVSTYSQIERMIELVRE